MQRFSRGYATRFKPGELAVLSRLKKGMNPKRWLSKPLEHGGKLGTDTGIFQHDDIIGTYPRSKIYETRGKKLFKYVVTRPNTEEYINMASRDAQPIYPLDAAAIVSLADLYIDFPEVNADGDLAEPPLQFFEAGTGHGSLTLQIAREIHAANGYAQQSGDLSKRGAVLHSVDCREKHSETGQRTLTHFRGGMYANDVEFHISESPTAWLGDECAEWRKLSCPQGDDADFQDQEAFLSGVFLDMGGFEEHLEAVSKAMLLDAPLVVFMPSLTQALDALRILDENPQIQLQFERTLQLLDGAGGGLKEWDTRKTFIKATQKAGWVCRPKVGIRVVGGGFVMVFRKPATNLDIAKELQEMQDYVPPVKEEDKEDKKSSDDLDESATATA